MATVNNQIGLWNRSSVVKKERQEAIVVAMQRHKIPVCVLPETRTVGRCAYQWPSGFTLHNSASLNNRGGIGFLMSDQIQINVFLPISERFHDDREKMDANRLLCSHAKCQARFV